MLGVGSGGRSKAGLKKSLLVLEIIASLCSWDSSGSGVPCQVSLWAGVYRQKVEEGEAGATSCCPLG